MPPNPNHLTQPELGLSLSPWAPILILILVLILILSVRLSL